MKLSYWKGTSDIHNEFLIYQIKQNKKHLLQMKEHALFIQRFYGMDFWLFVWFDYLRPSQQFFSYVGMGLSGLSQY